MRELSLFTGAGLGQWATKHLLGWRCLGYVEWDKYCQRVIRARIEDGLFDEAPIFTDVREFVQSGAARQYRGFADVVTGGFPCQPFSASGAMLGADDARNMWPAMRSTIHVVQPEYAFMENVPALLNSGYFDKILGDLAEMGMDAIWGVFSACASGAPHTRERLFVLAYAQRVGPQERQKQLARSAQGCKQRKTNIRFHDSEKHYLSIPPPIWDTMPSDILRVADGDTDRGHRIKACGNGWVPTVAATAWRTLYGELATLDSE